MRTPRIAHDRRRAYVAVIVLAATVMIVGFVVATWRLSAHAFERERRMQLEACCEQVLASAVAWTRAHADELTSDPRGLPCDAIVPAGYAGEVTVRIEPATGFVECHVVVTRGTLSIRRHVACPPPAPAAPTAPSD